MQSTRGGRAWLVLGLAASATVVASQGCSSTEERTKERTGATASALTTRIPVRADTYLKQGTPNQNQGTLTTLRLQARGKNRAIVRASSSDVAGLTPGASVSLELTITENAENWGPTGRAIAVHRLTHDWTELSATWNCAIDGDTSNSSPDCSGVTAWEMDKPQQPELHPWIATPTATAIITNTSAGLVTFDVTGDVELFKSGAVANYGWIIKKVDEGAAGRVEFASRETSTPPALVGTCADTVEAGVCDPVDGGMSGGDSGGANDGGGGGDAAGEVNDAGYDDSPACNLGTCFATFPCMKAECVSNQCVITFEPDGTSCSDSNACTTGDTCSSGACAGTPLDANDGNPCSVDSCDPQTGVHHDPAPPSTLCSTGSTCTTNDHCSGTDLTCVAGTPLPVNDGNPCTSDSCIEGIGVIHQPIPHCDPTPTQGELPFETRASLLGKLSAGGSAVTGASFSVVDLPSNTPRSDVVVSAASDGSFRIRLTTFPEVEATRSPPKHVLVRVEHSSYLPAFRDAWLHVGDAADLGIIKLVARDSNVTPIGPAGGTASDSQNRIQVVVPPGALAATTPIIITPIPQRDEMPAPLPDSTSTLYGFALEPSGISFALPVSVRLQNWRSAPTSIPIPTGFFSESSGRWVHETQATWDGTRFVFQTNHFSDWDCNFARPEEPALRPKPTPPPPLPPPLCPASSCDMAGGSLEQSFPLPTYRVKSEDFGLTLTYESGPGSSWKLGDAASGYAAVDHSTFAVPLPGIIVEATCVPSGTTLGSPQLVQPGRCVASAEPVGCKLGGVTPMAINVTRTVGGAISSTSVTVSGANAAAAFDTYVDLPNVSSDTTATSGLYRMRSVVKAQVLGACVGSGDTFGVSDPGATTKVQTNLEDGPLGTFDSHVLLRQRVTSPFGAGWAVKEASRVYRVGDVAHLASGDGKIEIFRPRAHARTLRTDIFRFIPARDALTGELFVALDDGVIARVDAVTGATTPVLSGLGFASPVHALAIAYAGASRRFIVALQNTLVEIDASGATQTLASRSHSVPLSQASLAANGSQVFYTDGIGPTLFRVLMTDPTRTVAPMTLSTGGDVRLYPQATLSGVRFAEPHGLAFGPNGVLYMSDRRRNAVYAIATDATGAISATSHVGVALGDGGAGTLQPPGEPFPAQALSIREPMALSMTEDGYVTVMTTYGFLSYDPIAAEAEWLAYFGSAGELIVDFARGRLGIVALTRTSLLTRVDEFPLGLARIDIDPMSSERVPTRTIIAQPDGTLELLDTMSERIETFDTAGRISAKKKRTGELTMQFEYADARSDKIARVLDAAGGSTTFSYDSRGKIESITDARGRTTTLTVDARGDLVSILEPGPENHMFLYESHRMTEKHSPRGDVSHYAFREDGTLSEATRPEGATLALDPSRRVAPAFNAAGAIERRASTIDAHGVAHSLVFSPENTVLSDTYVIDGVTRVKTANLVGEVLDESSILPISRDLFSRRRNTLLELVESTSENGVITSTTSTFDAHGRKRREWRHFPNSLTVAPNRWVYDSAGWLVEEQGPGANLTQGYDRDSAGHVLRIFDQNPNGNVPSGRETVWTYRPDGLVATRTDHGITRTFTYDDAGGTLNETGWTDTIGRSMAYTHDAYGNVTSTNDGTATTFASFDVRNRVTETRDALGNATSYGYSHAGCGCSLDDLVTSIHTPDLAAGIAWEMDYDGDRRLKSVTDPHGFTESYEYEPNGEMKRLTDKLSRATSWTHDGLGRVKTMIDTLGRHHGNTYTTPLGGAFSGPSLMAGSNDSAPSTTSLTGSLRSGDYQIGHNAYQPFGMPAAISLYRDATFELAYWHDFQSAASPRLAHRQDRTSLSIDSTTPSQGNGPHSDEGFSYDPRSSASIVTSLFADQIGNAAFSRDHWFDTFAHFGHRTSATPPFGDPFVDENITRDPAGRVTQVQRFFRVNTFTVPEPPAQLSTYVYRLDGRLERITNPDGIHEFTYNSRGLVETQMVSGDGTYTYGYDEMGRNDYLEFPDGHVRRQLFDDVGRITSRCYEYTGGADTHCYTATYDPVGNPLSMLDPEGEDVFEYDGLDRLKKATRKNDVGTVIEVDDYEYNALGALKKNANVVLDDQRPRLDGAGMAASAVPATSGGRPVTLDPAGRVTSFHDTTLTWTKKGYVVHEQAPVPAARVTYGVDFDLRRVMRLQGSTAEFYFYEGLDRVATLMPSGALKEGYLFDGIDHPLRLKHAGGVAYYELDLVGNVRRLRNSGGSDLGGYRYTAFGKTKEDTATLVQSLRWKARWHSTLNGAEVYDVRARQWAPDIGAFLTVDEYWAFWSTHTLWSWPHQNPIRYSDPSGRLDMGTLVAVGTGVFTGGSGAAAVAGAAVIGLLLPPSGPGLPSGGTGPGQGSGGGTPPTPAPDDPGPGAIGPEPPGEGPAGPGIGPLPGGGTGPGAGPGLGPMDSGGGPGKCNQEDPQRKKRCTDKALKVFQDCMKVEQDTYKCLDAMHRAYVRCMNAP